MPIVHTKHATDKSVDVVWAALLDCEAFPSYMDEVVAVELLSVEGTQRVARWAVMLKGSELEWDEAEVIDHERHRIEFRQLEGDLAYFTGHWHVTDAGQATLVELYVDFDIGIPLMADMLNPVAARALEDNSKAMLASLSDSA